MILVMIHDSWLLACSIFLYHVQENEDHDLIMMIMNLDNDNDNNHGAVVVISQERSPNMIKYDETMTSIIYWII